MAANPAGPVIAARGLLPDEMSRIMIADAVESAPKEACGLVLYDQAGRPTRIYRTNNIHPDESRFEVDPVQHFRIINEADLAGQRIGALYHSHPHGPPRPSPIDLAIDWDPEWVHYLIGRTLTGKWAIRAYSIRDGRATRLDRGRRRGSAPMTRLSVDNRPR
ncbi:MAG: M67 family metallopeptidase [Acidimicrobiia bacterium]|nr:M67 family metallopeptidase [Acidimicrobiia bacterium]